jgi:hypothetical protein
MVGRKAGKYSPLIWGFKSNPSASCNIQNCMAFAKCQLEKLKLRAAPRHDQFFCGAGEITQILIDKPEIFGGSWSVIDLTIINSFQFF